MFRFLTTLAFTVSFDIFLRTGGKYVTAVDQLAAIIVQHFKISALVGKEDQALAEAYPHGDHTRFCNRAGACTKPDRKNSRPERTFRWKQLQCAAYFSATAYCINGYPAPSVPKIVRDYQQVAKTAPVAPSPLVAWRA